MRRVAQGLKALCFADGMAKETYHMAEETYLYPIYGLKAVCFAEGMSIYGCLDPDHCTRNTKLETLSPES